MMTKILKIVLNAAIFLVVICFIWYSILRLSAGEETTQTKIAEEPQSGTNFKQIATLELPSEINRFELQGNKLFISAGEQVYVYDTTGTELATFPAGQNIRDIAVDGETVYLLYPASIEVRTAEGKLLRQWEACSELSDYCSLASAGGFIFVTDAENKNICKYTAEGNFVTFINSPADFIIPSYSFDIGSWNDTLYCTNSGRHLIESYTLDGNFIAAFGGPGSEAGSFAGCCNPAYISFTGTGQLIASEKGNPRVTSFSRNGSLNSILLNSHLLGGGSRAYEVREHSGKLFVAGKNRITVYRAV